MKRGAFALAALVLLAVFASANRASAEPNGSEVREIQFWSAALQKTTKVTVILPPGFDRARGPYRVVYMLHGSANETQNAFGPAVLGQLVDDLASANVVGVLPDSGGPWTDGRGPQPRTVSWEVRWPAGNEPAFGVNRGRVSADPPQYNLALASYEQYLLRELMPFLESEFNVSGDRSGRAVFGHSAGGYGSFILAMRHPDLFSFVGSASGPLSWQHPSPLGSPYGLGAPVVLLWGGRDPVTDDVTLRARDPLYLAENLLGTGMTIMHSAGCVHPLPIWDPTCRAENEVVPWEGFVRHMNNQWDAHANEIRLPHSYIRLDGENERTHDVKVVGVPVYERHFIPGAVATFANPPKLPTRWRYLTIDRDFAVWGWRFHVDRPNVEFLRLTDVSEGGFVAEGTGALVVETPRKYSAGDLYQVTVARPDGRSEKVGVRADAEGRLRFTVRLGAPRAADQSWALEEAGLFTFERYTVSIVKDAQASSTDAAACPEVWIYPVIRCDG